MQVVVKLQSLSTERVKGKLTDAPQTKAGKAGISPILEVVLQPSSTENPAAHVV